jgi:hypothetical protein
MALLQRNGARGQQHPLKIVEKTPINKKYPRETRACGGQKMIGFF